MIRKIVVLLLTAAPMAHAEPWLCTDPHGNKAWSYDPASAAMKNCEHKPIPSANVWRVRPREEHSVQRTPGFPSVDAKTQAKRDATRRDILEHELAQEKKALSEAMAALAEQQRAVPQKRGTATEDTLRPYRDRVRVHLTNIANIEKELGLGD